MSSAHSTPRQHDPWIETSSELDSPLAGCWTMTVAGRVRLLSSLARTIPPTCTHPTASARDSIAGAIKSNGSEPERTRQRSPRFQRRAEVFGFPQRSHAIHRVSTYSSLPVAKEISHQRLPGSTLAAALKSWLTPWRTPIAVTPCGRVCRAERCCPQPTEQQWHRQAYVEWTDFTVPISISAGTLQLVATHQRLPAPRRDNPET